MLWATGRHALEQTTPLRLTKNAKRAHKEIWSGDQSMAKFAIWAALAAFCVVAAVTLVSIHPQKVEAECKATDC